MAQWLMMLLISHFYYLPALQTFEPKEFLNGLNGFLCLQFSDASLMLVWTLGRILLVFGLFIWFLVNLAIFDRFLNILIANLF